MRPRHVLLAVLAVSLLAVPAAAHVPDFAADNTSPETAHEVEPATTSWAIYDSLGRDQVRYYELRLEAGERLELALLTPRGGPFEPSMAVMSPALDGNDDVPDRVTVPDGYGVEVVEGEKAAEPTFEPNTPAANYDVASLEREVDEGGRYLVAVYEPDGRAGQVGVVAGDRETFTVAQYVTVAWDLYRIYLWEGDHPLVVFGPSLLVVLGGLAAVRRRLGDDEPGASDGAGTAGKRLPRYALATAGLVCVGTAANVLVQTVLAVVAAGPTAAVVVPLVFVVLPATLGGVVAARAVDPGFGMERQDRAVLAVAGLLSLGTWAGWVVAPLALLGFAAAPGGWFERARAVDDR
jgi:hypothetical protein